MSRFRWAMLAALLTVVTAATVLPIPVGSQTSPVTLAAASGAAAAAQAPGHRPAAVKPGVVQSPLVAAKSELRAARRNIAVAHRTAGQLRARANHATSNAVTTRQDLGNMIREAYAVGPADLAGLASVIDSPDPAGAISRASIAGIIATRQAQAWKDAQQTVRNADDLRSQASALVHTANLRLRAATVTLNNIRHRNVMAELAAGPAPGDGLSLIKQRCADAGVDFSLCHRPPWPEAHLTFDAVVIERYVRAHWSQIKVVGGWRPYDPYPDHPSGRATDIMMPNKGKGTDVALGNSIVRYFEQHSANYGIYYILWRQRMWRASDPIGSWVHMADRGSPTDNHMDHVHISVSNGQEGTAFVEAMVAAQEAAGR